MGRARRFDNPSSRWWSPHREDWPALRSYSPCGVIPNSRAPAPSGAPSQRSGAGPRHRQCAFRPGRNGSGRDSTIRVVLTLRCTMRRMAGIRSRVRTPGGKPRRVGSAGSRYPRSRGVRSGKRRGCATGTPATRYWIRWASGAPRVRFNEPAPRDPRGTRGCAAPPTWQGAAPRKRVPLPCRVPATGAA